MSAQANAIAKPVAKPATESKEDKLRVREVLFVILVCIGQFLVAAGIFCAKALWFLTKIAFMILWGIITFSLSLITFGAFSRG